MAAEDYVGPPGHEKKFHKTHFPAPGRKFKTTKDNGYEWVQIRVGRYVRRKKNGNSTAPNT
jgi:hypothetical protein